MRLTKSDKEAFVRAVMDDVPMVDYDEQVRSLVKACGLSTVPEELRPFVKTHPGYFDTRYIGTPSHCVGAYAVVDPNKTDISQHDPELWAKLIQIGLDDKAQDQCRADLKAKITGLINECSTLKAAKQRLPEFEKYLPAERGVTGTINLPVANVLAELTNLGWPKGEPLCAS